MKNIQIDHCYNTPVILTQKPWLLICLSFFFFLFLSLTILGCHKSQTALTGKVLHLIVRDNVATGDPTQASDIFSVEVAQQVYETLLQYDYYKDVAEPIPLLTESMPWISEDGKTYTIKLKKGIYFQNDPCFKKTNGKGRELRAQDFIYGWKRAANPKTASQNFWQWDGKIVGINDFQKKFSSGRSAEEIMKDEVEGFKALDDYTIQIKTLKPYPQLLYVLTMLSTAPVPQEADEMYGKDLSHHPVGTGPFRVVSWNSTSQILMVKNENYHEDHFPDVSKLQTKYASLAPYSGKRLPLADGIEFTVSKEEQPRWLNFLNGKIDQIEIPKDNFNTAVVNNEVTPELKAKGIFVSIEPSYDFWHVGITFKDKLLSTNKYLRQAIASAVDAKEWMHIFKNDRGILQTEVNPPSIKDRCGKRPYRWTYNPERAKQLLAKAGFPGGKGLPVFKWDTRGPDQSERQLAEFMQKKFAEVGIQIEIIANTFPAYIDKMAKGNLQISKGGWVMDYPDAENNMQLLYGPNGPPGPNFSAFNNEKYNKLYEKMAVMLPSPKRNEILCQMEDIIQEEVPWAYAFHEIRYRLVQPWLKTYHTAELVYNKYKYIDVDKK